MRGTWGVGTWMTCGAAALGIVGLAACGDDARRPVGAVCSASGQCESGICGGGLCLDPAGDADGDGLINATEAALRTDPVSGDTDGDGVSDADEVGADTTAAPDADGDGKIDAIESLIEDCDGDEIVDQLDPTDGANADGTCGGGTVKVDACPELCTATGALGCEGFEQRGCVAECREIGAPYTSGGCGEPWLAFTTCLSQLDGLECATGDEPTQLPRPPDGSCESESTALLACAEGCQPAEALEIGVRVDDELPAGGSRAFVASVTQGGTYIVAVGHRSADDDPDMAIFESDARRCVYETSPGSGEVTPLYVGDKGGPGQAEATSIFADGDVLVVLVEAQADAPLRFSILVDAAFGEPR